MDDTHLKTLVGAQIKDAIGYLDSEIAAEQRENLDFYFGEKFGNEVPGRSQVVSRDVMDVIEWIMPSLMEVFHGGGPVVEYEPQGPEDEQAAEQATDYANHIYNVDNDGFLITHTWCKDALIQKLGVVKVYWDVVEKVKEGNYSGLTGDELTLLADDDGVEVVGQEVDEATGLYSVRLRRTVKQGKVCIDPVPPEEFLVSRRARKLDMTTDFCAHRTRLTRTQLIEQGYDARMVARLPADAGDFDEDSENRYEQESSHGDTPAQTDPSMAEVLVTECYMWVDYDGDGKAEYRKIKAAGNNAQEILDNEEIDYCPFHGFCPIMMPHTIWGQAAVDAVKDLQLLKSTIWRQMLDGLYLANNPRWLVHGGPNGDDVQMDDLLTDRPGNVIRAKGTGDVTPLLTQWPGQQVFPMLDYIDRVREGRTGVSQQTMGLNPDALNNQAGADANSKILDAAAQRVKLIARVLAETGMKPLFRCILHLTTKYQDKERVIRLRNQWVPIDPRAWNADMDVRVNVGLGTGDKTLKALFLQSVLMLQKEGMPLGLADARKIFNALKEFVGTAGFGDVDQFFLDPTAPDYQPPPTPPDPKMVEVQAKAQLEQQKAQIDMQMEQQKTQMQMQADQMRMQQEMALKREQMDREFALKEQQLVREMDLKERQIAAELELKREQNRMMAQVKVATSPVRPGGDPG